VLVLEALHIRHRQRFGPPAGLLHLGDQVVWAEVFDGTERASPILRFGEDRRQSLRKSTTSLEPIAGFLQTAIRSATAT
jgi:hypothetical protein